MIGLLPPVVLAFSVFLRKSACLNSLRGTSINEAFYGVFANPISAIINLFYHKYMILIHILILIRSSTKNSVDRSTILQMKFTISTDLQFFDNEISYRDKRIQLCSRISTQEIVMNLRDINLSEVQDLTYRVEYLVQNLKTLQQSSPKSELLLVRLEKANAQLQHNIEFGMKGLEAALNAIDYDKINDRIVDAVHRHSSKMNNAIERIKTHSSTLEQKLVKNESLLKQSSALLEQANDKIVTLNQELGTLPVQNSRILLGASALSFVGGMIFLYLISFILWLPKPYYATSEQTVLLQMVKDNTLKIDTDSYQNMRVSIDSNAFHSLNKNSTNNTGEKQ
jgi:hypothetical protein